MRELQDKQRMKRRFYSLPVLLALLLLAGALAKGAYSMLVTERRVAREAELLALQVATLQAREAELAEALKRLETESGIEEEIKSKYNVVREGERVAVIVDAPQAEAEPEPQEEPWYKGLLDFFRDAIIGSNE